MNITNNASFWFCFSVCRVVLVSLAQNLLHTPSPRNIAVYGWLFAVWVKEDFL